MSPKQSNDDNYVTLVAGDTSLVLDCAFGQSPSLLYWGAKLGSTRPDSLKRMTVRQHMLGGADIDIPGSLLNEIGIGLAGSTGFSAHRDGKSWASVFAVTSVERLNEHEVVITSEDTANDVQIVHTISLGSTSHLLTCQTRIINCGVTDLSVDECAAACLPLDQRAEKLICFTGRWAGEFQMEEIPPLKGGYVRENKAGRTSHDSFPGLIAKASGTNESNGMAFGFHLGWSGNNRVRVDRLNDGRSFVQMGEYFLPGEMKLAPGETYTSPVLYAGFSAKGLSALSRKFHTHVRHSTMDGRIQAKPRPIHYNTWEAIYFDHDMEKLFALADKAAEVGAERYILDDGWFGGRRNDAVGLGDWFVSKEVYPDGLGPLIEKVTSLGMEFGLWFEPEMVNPDSDLFRAHPDWVLRADGVPQVPFRNQYVLDLTREEVADYLFKCINDLLGEYDISYIKWDMNRDIHHPGSNGRAVASKQTHALYKLIDRIRSAHPSVEIESCSSGGGRVDYGVLQRTDRIWTSDTNDALDRQRIQRGASYFVPLEIMGAHVGPEVCHITGRRLSMELRVATALFGHMGMELNLLEESDEALEVLKRGLALHKEHRDLIHSGDLYRLDTPDHVNAIGVITADKTEALFSWCNLTGHRETLPGRIYFVGLSPERNYRVQIVWPSPVKSRTQPSIIEACQLDEEGAVISGEALMQAGMQAPVLYPETCLIYHLQAEPVT